MNEEHNLSRKAKDRQLLKIIYSNEKYGEEFKEFCLYAMNDNNDILKVLNDELSYQHETFHPDYGSICSERPLVDYHRGIRISDMKVKDSDTDTLALDITNKIRTKVRRTLRKSCRKFMKQSDIKTIEKELFQHYDDKFDDCFLYLPEDDISDIKQIFGGDNNCGEPVNMKNDFSEEILDMPVISDWINQVIR